jgi:hypothetical protein
LPIYFSSVDPALGDQTSLFHSHPDVLQSTGVANGVLVENQETRFETLYERPILR